jgi:hypothetical protein
MNSDNCCQIRLTYNSIDVAKWLGGTPGLPLSGLYNSAKSSSRNNLLHWLARYP